MSFFFFKLSYSLEVENQLSKFFPHLQTIVALSVLFPVIAWLITSAQRDDMSAGIGSWIGLISGIALLGVSVFELTKREVTAS
mgnify:CR=1 FL=1